MAAIVFDLDGTLVDSAPDLHALANGVLGGVGAPPITLAEARSFIGRGVHSFVSQMCAARGIPSDERPRLLAAFLDGYEHAIYLTRPYAGVEAALLALRGGGHRLGICTNKPKRPAEALLAHLRFDALFAVVLGGDSLPVCKPDPAPLLAAFSALEDPIRLFVGDSEVDAEAARRAGVPFLLFGEGYRTAPVEEIGAAAAFSSFADLPALVEALTVQPA